MVNAMSQAPRSRSPRLALLLATALSLGACSFIDAPPLARGHRITADQLASLVPGVQARADVQTLLGTPTARSTFDDNNWYYISAVSRNRPMQKEHLSEQRVVVVEFDDAGKLKSVRELTEADGRSVSMVSRETPVPGNERTTLQALFGNVGRFNPLGGGTGITNTNPGATQPNSTRLN